MTSSVSTLSSLRVPAENNYGQRRTSLEDPISVPIPRHVWGPTRLPVSPSSIVVEGAVASVVSTRIPSGPYTETPVQTISLAGSPATRHRRTYASSHIQLA